MRLYRMEGLLGLEGIEGVDRLECLVSCALILGVELIFRFFTIKK